MFTYRFCFYAFKTIPWLLGVSWLLNMLFSSGQPCGYTSPIEAVWVLLFGIMIVGGLYLGIRLQRRSLALLCPFCSRPGMADMHRSEGLKMECPACGEIRGGGALGWTIIREEEAPPEVPETATSWHVMKFHFRSPWFWGLFSPSLLSALCGVVIHQFSFFTVFAPLWCFFVASHLVQTMITGCLDDNAGPTFRHRQPLKFWLRTAIWFLGYAFAVYLPIGYALQERGKEQAKTEAVSKAKR